MPWSISSRRRRWCGGNGDDMVIPCDPSPPVCFSKGGLLRNTRVKAGAESAREMNLKREINKKNSFIATHALNSIEVTMDAAALASTCRLRQPTHGGWS